DIYPGSAFSDSRIAELTDVNGVAYFRAYGPGVGEELWRSDGTEAGTFVVKDIAQGGPSANDSSPYELTNVSGTLFFVAGWGDLWKTDGTEAGTIPLITSSVSDYANLVNVNGLLYFGAAYNNDGSGGGELWTSDGTQDGTRLIPNPGPDGTNALPY